MLVKYRAQIYGPGAGTLMDGSYCFSTPPTILFLTEGGGGGMDCFLVGPLSLRGRNPLVLNPTASHGLTYPVTP
jgi:hypothetical protein